MTGNSGRTVPVRELGLWDRPTSRHLNLATLAHWRFTCGQVPAGDDIFERVVCAVLSRLSPQPCRYTSGCCLAIGADLPGQRDDVGTELEEVPVRLIRKH